jgi:hypothetical protein
MKGRLAVVAVLFCGALARASTLYDNTGVTAGAPNSVAGATLFNSFSTGAVSGALSGLELVLDVGTPSDGGSVTVSLYGNSTSCGGLGTSSCPGSFITTLGTVADSSLESTPTPPVTVVSLTANPVLSTATRYWIAVGGSGSGSAFWVEASTNTGTGVSGEFWGDGNYPYTSTFATFLNSTAPGEEMQVTVGTPEPSTVWLCAWALVAVVARRSARRSMV